MELWEIGSDSDWGFFGPIIEREKVGLGHEICDGNSYWVATGYLVEECGPTPLIAAMRCFVAIKLGDEVDVPDDVLKDMELDDLIYDRGDE
jgi:hypothetical protein